MKKIKIVDDGSAYGSGFRIYEVDSDTGEERILDIPIYGYTITHFVGDVSRIQLDVYSPQINVESDEHNLSKEFVTCGDIKEMKTLTQFRMENVEVD